MDITIGKYRHYKGKEYEVLGIAIHSETLEKMVVYKPLYDTEHPLWVRPAGMFSETVLINGKHVQRFEKIPEHA